MDKVYVIASTLADIGKGWLTASIGNLVGGHPIKIDPALNALHVSRDMEGSNPSLVSTDAPTYEELGLNFGLQDIIRGGDIFYEFLQRTRKPIEEFDPYTERRKTFSDVSEFLANRIEELVKEGNYVLPVIEMGGSVYDDNLQYLADGVRRFANDNNAELDVVLLTYLTSSDDNNHAVKVNHAVDGIKKSTEVYSGEPKYIFVRDRVTYGKMKAEEIDFHIRKIAHRTHIPTSRIKYEPEVESATSLKDYIESLGLFAKPKEPYIRIPISHLFFPFFGAVDLTLDAIINEN